MSTFFFPPSPTSNPLSGAVIYDPYRDIAGRNILPVGSDNFVTGWTAGGTDVPVITLNQPDPDGGNSAVRVQCSGTGIKYGIILGASILGAKYGFGLWAKSNNGESPILEGNTTPTTAVTISSANWAEYQVLSAAITNITTMQFIIYKQGYSAAHDLDITLYKPKQNIGSLAPYSAPAGRPLTALNYGVGSSLHNAQLGSAAGSDTNDPTWGATGLVFGADDFLKITSSWFDDMAAFTVITAFKKSTAVNTGARFFDKSKRSFYVNNATGKLVMYQARTSSYNIVIGNTTLANGNSYIVAGMYNSATFDMKMYAGTALQTLTPSGAGSGNNTSDATDDLFIGNNTAADQSINDTVYLQVWFNRVLTDAQYLAAYRYIKSLLASRGVTV